MIKLGTLIVAWGDIYNIQIQFDLTRTDSSQSESEITQEMESKENKFP